LKEQSEKNKGTSPTDLDGALRANPLKAPGDVIREVGDYYADFLKGAIGEVAESLAQGLDASYVSADTNTERSK
jgi:hypothetical protein